MRSRLLTGLVLCGVLMGSSVSAREIYVHNTKGSDEFYGLTESPTNQNGPVRTIQRALEVAHGGDTVVLMKSDEPYRDSATLYGQKNSCVPGFTFVLDGNGAILDGSEPIPDAQWHPIGQNGIFSYEPVYTAYLNLYKAGVPLEKVNPQTLADKDGLVDLTKLQEMQWCLYNGLVYFRPANDTLPEEHKLSISGHRNGLALLHVRGVEIKNLTIQGFQHDGIIASNAATDIHLENVVCRGNARAGVTVCEGCSLWLKDSLVGNNCEAQLLTEPLAQVSIFNTTLISNTAPSWVDNSRMILANGEILENTSAVFRDGKQIEGGLVEEIPPAEEEDEPAENAENAEASNAEKADADAGKKATAADEDEEDADADEDEDADTDAKKSDKDEEAPEDKIDADKSGENFYIY